MASKKQPDLRQFAASALTPEEARRVKGGSKAVPGMPGGNGSIGLIDWGEVEIRDKMQANLWMYAHLTTASSNQNQ